MLYNPEMEEAYQKLLYRIMDIRDEQHCKIKDLCEAAGISMGHYHMLFRNREKGSGIKALMSVVDALGYRFELVKKEE